MTRTEILNKLTNVFAQLKEVAQAATPDNTDGQVADIKDCIWRLEEIVGEMLSADAIEEPDEPDTSWHEDNYRLNTESIY